MSAETIPVGDCQINQSSMPSTKWIDAAVQHKEQLRSILYPKGMTFKDQQHSVGNHPIYNFLHRYYRYSKEELFKYSPGMDVELEFDGSYAARSLLSSKFLVVNEKLGSCSFSAAEFRKQVTSDGKLGSIYIQQNYIVLLASSRKAPFFGCFGFHEWAMLYSGRDKSKPLKKHQEQLKLRISQEVIDNVVESSQLRCTHFDAWRFFHPDAQPMNIISPLTRQSQSQYEQPGCIHANMDLFKYAYQLYPLVSSELLLESLKVALAARIIDMRASPYDVSAYEECRDPICVETAEGRKTYAEEQEKLANMAAPVRRALLEVYSEAFSNR